MKRETTEEDDVKLSAEDEERREQWDLVFALRAGSLALRKEALRAHERGGNGGGEMEAAFRTADRKNTEADTLLAHAEELMRELDGAQAPEV